MTRDGRLRAQTVWFFDCDGVLLDSNDVKSAAFRAVALRYGKAVADDVVSHHLNNGGVSRFVKLRRIFTDVLDRPAEAGEYEELLEVFAEHCRRSLTGVGTDPHAAGLLTHLRRAGAARHVVTGGQQEEVAWALEHHQLAVHFDGIHGSPRTKPDIIFEVLDETGARPESCVVVGDSRLDMTVAAELGLRQVFVSHWTEFTDWRAHVATEPEILSVRDLAELHDALLGRVALDPLRNLGWVRSCA